LVVEPERAKHGPFEELGVSVATSAGEGMAWLEGEESRAGLRGQLFLAFKPQILGQFADEVRASLSGPARVVITILAGTPTAKVHGAFGGAARVVRAMPNLAATIRQGATAICLGAGALQGDDALARAIFEDVGQLVVTIDESLMDAFTAIAGSGPAYIFYLAESMVHAAVKLGFPPEMARDIVRETVAGSGNLLVQSFDDPGTLRAAVTSKGGTTEAALRVFEARGVKEAIVDALVAARDRGVELGAG
jgi:pyrroline-5-carboxylate reductase